jgi:hypothetical protein
MKTLASVLALATTLLPTALAHGYVNTALISGITYTFYQPYADPYMNPPVSRIARPIQGNGPVQDVTLSDLQCGGYAEGGKPGSSPAALHANVTVGADVKLYWTLWPDSHVGPTITYMARCPDTGCDKWMPGTAYVFQSHSFLCLNSDVMMTDAMTQRRMVQSPRIRTHRHVECLGRYGAHVRRRQRNVHGAQMY